MRKRMPQGLHGLPITRKLQRQQHGTLGLTILTILKIRLKFSFLKFKLKRKSKLLSNKQQRGFPK
jgi:hypothetical protein